LLAFLAIAGSRLHALHGRSGLESDLCQDAEDRCHIAGERERAPKNFVTGAFAHGEAARSGRQSYTKRCARVFSWGRALSEIASAEVQKSIKITSPPSYSG
jgi:hypothetical protein